MGEGGAGVRVARFIPDPGTRALQGCRSHGSTNGSPALTLPSPMRGHREAPGRDRWGRGTTAAIALGSVSPRSVPGAANHAASATGPETTVEELMRRRGLEARRAVRRGSAFGEPPIRGHDLTANQH